MRVPNKARVAALGAIIIGVGLAGCGGEQSVDQTQLQDLADAAGQGQDALDQAAEAPAAREALMRGQAFLAENALAEGVFVTPSGLQYKVLNPGDEQGLRPTASDMVQVHYRGRLIDGSEFDSSYRRGRPAAFPLNRVIAGWTEGVQLMREGASYRFFIPAELAYGEQGSSSGSIGPNETLIFDVELLAVNPAQKAAREALARGQAFLAENAARPGVQITDSGLQYLVSRNAEVEGDSPEADDTVRVHYRGAFINGDVFESSYDAGAPIEFSLDGVIPGWTEGVQLMGEGDKYRFFIPAELAYGEDGAGGVIGPNEVLVFDIELLEVVGGAEN